MKRNIGNALALYPTPLVVVGAMVNEKPTWTLVGHLGIMGHDHVMVSLASVHYINQGIREGKALSVNIVDERLLPNADYVGTVSGAEKDKSTVFPWQPGETGAPMIDDAPVSMDCTVDDIYATAGFENFICRINGVYAGVDVLSEQGRLDYRKLKPVLFEMPTYEYLRTGDVLGKCMTMGKEIK